MEELRILQDAINGNLEEIFRKIHGIINGWFSGKLETFLKNVTVYGGKFKNQKSNSENQNQKSNSWKVIFEKKKATVKQTVILVVMTLGISKKSSKYF